MSEDFLRGFDYSRIAERFNMQYAQQDAQVRKAEILNKMVELGTEAGQLYVDIRNKETKLAAIIDEARRLNDEYSRLSD